jgi:hypothetical protein
MTGCRTAYFVALGILALAGAGCVKPREKSGNGPQGPSVSRNDGGMDAGRGDGGSQTGGGGGGNGECQPGSPCLLTDSPCLAGETECNGGAATCKRTDKRVANGTACGPDAVCSEGDCMPCTRGASCMLDGKPCRSGAIECGGGKPECLETGNAADGTSCGVGMVCQQGACTMCMAGAMCVPMNPCHEGTLDCAGAAPVCNDAARNRTAGETCGTDKVCNPTGECVACMAGMTCDLPDPCKVGKIDCISGAPVCVETGPAAPGKSCGNNLVCNEGRCVSCTEGQACTPTNKCHIGTLSCMTGTPQCTDTTRNVANGTSCGTNQVCNNGTCAACTANVSCDTGNPCKLGTTNCESGTSQCRETGNAPNGRGCGAGRVCNNGSCVACTPNTECQPSACKVGMTSCSTGTSECRETGNAPNGSNCGTGRVCNNGSCQNCNQGGTCTLSNPCKRGTISCSTGAAVCMDAGNASDGTGCGGSRVCVGGTCRDCNPSAPPICRNDQRITCTSGGTENVDNCGGNGCTGNACNVCRPGSVRCSGNQLQDCNNSGDWQTRSTCNLGCSNNMCITCQPSTETCNGRDDDCDNQVDEGSLCTSGPSGSTGRCNGSGGCSYTCPSDRTIVCNNVCRECCSSGDCGSGQACMSGTCRQCRNSGSCTTNQNSGCRFGQYRCENDREVCADAGNKENGTNCGTDRVCLNGICNSCAQGDECGDVCNPGRITCITGRPECFPSTPPPDGTKCGAERCSCHPQPGDPPDLMRCGSEFPTCNGGRCDPQAVGQRMCPNGCNSAGNSCR